ncbi:hypothetical protein MMC10_004656 [Thelotrema lepadinum]|nr:hypothetical protein [Thelotrema lepadinum]
MALVGYSDSEGSSDEAPKKAPPKSTTSSKHGSHKLIDRSNPQKIRVNLPESSAPKADIAEQDEERPAKKAKTAGSFGGFNAMLPAPKKTGAKGASKGMGLGRGVSLKTSSEVGFSREPAPSFTSEATEEKEPREVENGDTTIDLPTTEKTADEKPAQEPKTIGNPMMFKPLSVARKPQKKKKPTGNTSATSTPGPTSSQTPSKSDTETPPPPKPKVSLFSTPTDDDTLIIPSTSTGSYQPLIHTPSTAASSSQEAPSPSNPPSTLPPPTPGQEQHTASLSSLASSLNLPPSARRQLFGRPSSSSPHTQSPSDREITLTTFNTSAEWSANEALRASGAAEQHRHNPVRGIQGGKHSLMQLVSAVSNQKEALEESFAEGRRKRGEGGARYGWS